MNLMNNNNDIIDIYTRSVSKKNPAIHVTFGPVLYKAKDFNSNFKLHMDTYSTNDSNNDFDDDE